MAVGKMKSENLTVVEQKISITFYLNFCSQNIIQPNFICNERGGRHAGRVCKPQIENSVVKSFFVRGDEECCVF